MPSTIEGLRTMKGPLGDMFRYSNEGFEETLGKVADNVDLVFALLAQVRMLEHRADLTRAPEDIARLVDAYEAIVKEYGYQ